MDKRELSMLRTGFVNLLPSDSDGCPVLWIDCSRLPNILQNTSRTKCLFYMFSVLTENEQSQRQGAVLLYNMIDSPTTSVVNADVVANLEHIASLEVQGCASNHPAPDVKRRRFFSIQLCPEDLRTCKNIKRRALLPTGGVWNE